MREILKLAQWYPTIYQLWKIKEVLDHITVGDDAVLAFITSFLAGEIAATPPHARSTLITQTLSLHAKPSPTKSQRKWEASYTELLTSCVLPWAANGTIEDLVEIFTEHEAKEISEILAKDNTLSPQTTEL